uniref:Uncharacterized protein n=1 Tax=Arundo donax TaxID=35708 RepID=A0A0A8XQ26_ARUDO
MMASRSGSGPLGAVAQICWLGQPAHASAFPAVSDCVPGQCSLAFSGTPPPSPPLSMDSGGFPPPRS